MDGDAMPVDLNVGQADVGDGFHPIPDLILALHLERHQCGVVPTEPSHGVGAGALKVEITLVEGAVVGIPPSPARGHQGGDTLGLAVLQLAPLPRSAPEGFAGVCKEKKHPWGAELGWMWDGCAAEERSRSALSPTIPFSGRLFPNFMERKGQMRHILSQDPSRSSRRLKLDTA